MASRPHNTGIILPILFLLLWPAVLGSADDSSSQGWADEDENSAFDSQEDESDGLKDADSQLEPSVEPPTIDSIDSSLSSDQLESTSNASQSEAGASLSSNSIDDSSLGGDQSNRTEEAQPPPQQTPVRPKRRFNCTGANRTADSTSQAGIVTLINSTDFAELRAAVAPPPPASPASDANAHASVISNQSECAVLLYYLPYCPYSVLLAPHFNALARAFPGLHFFAVDADHVSPFYANYTTSLAPYIRVFRDKDLIGVNTSLRTLEALTTELANLTGHVPVPDVTVTEADFSGPVSASLTEATDYWLALSCLYFLLLSLYVAARWPRARTAWSLLRQRLLASLRGRGRSVHTHAE